MEIFLHIITRNIVPIFILIAIGFLVGRRFDMDTGTLTKINFYAFLPFFSFVIIYTNDLASGMGKTLLFAVIFMFLNAAAAWFSAGLRRVDVQKRHLLVNSVIFYNSGNIGIPLITLIFTGTPWLNQALVVQITIMLVQTLTTNTIGFYNAGRGNLRWHESVMVVLKMPVVYALLAAVLLKQIPFDIAESFVWPAFLYLKEALIGFVLVTLGVQLSKTSLSAKDPDVLISVLLRLLGGPLIALLILKIGGYSGVAARVLLIASAAPTAVTTALIAIERGAEPEFASKAVAFSTIASSVTLVFVVYFSAILFPL